MAGRNPTRWHGCRLTSLTWNGQDVLLLENEVLRVGVNLSKGAEIFEFRHKPSDVDAMCHFDRPDTHTSGFDLAANSLDAFFDQYTGGWQESFPVGNTAGVFEGAQMYLHGEVCLLPWQWQVLDDSPRRLQIELAVECLRTPFRVRRRMGIETGMPALQIEETVTNAGRQTVPYAWGHHIAFGPPLLDAEARLDLPEGTVRTLPGNDNLHRRFEGKQRSTDLRLRGKTGTLVDLTVAPPPESGTIDNFEIEVHGPAFAAIRNPRLDLGVGVLWARETLPYLWEWELCHAQSGYPFWGREYLLALEPFNCPIGGLTDPDNRGRLPQLEPDQEIHLKLLIGWCAGREPFRGNWTSDARKELHHGI